MRMFSRALCCLLALLLPAAGAAHAQFLGGVAAQPGRLILTPTPLEATLALDDVNDAFRRYNEAVAPYGGGTLPTADTGPATVDVGEAFDVLSLSPDGSLALGFVGDRPALLDLQAPALRLLTPPAGLEAERADTLLRQLSRLEDGGVQWAPDGRMLVLSFPRQVLIMANFSMDLLLVDAADGTVTPVMNLPQPNSIRSPDFPGAPVYATFDPTGGTLYYAVYGVYEPSGTKVNALMARDLTTGQESRLSVSNASETGLSPLLCAPDGTLGRTFAGVTRDRGFGLLLTSPAGQNKHIRVLHDALWPYAGAVLRSLAGGYALCLNAYVYTAEAETPRFPYAVHLFPYADSGPDAFALALAVDPGSADTPAQAVRVDLRDAAQVEAALAACHLPYNAVLSPDGQHALLLTLGRQTHQSFLYRYHIATDTLLPVDLSVIGEDLGVLSLWASGNGGSPYRLGLRWDTPDRILLGLEEGYQVFTLTEN